MIREVPAIERDDAIAAVAQMRRNLPAVLEMVVIDAEIRRKKYCALIQQGFSEQQALELCKGSYL